jgi:uncharacterized protein (TIGR00730 family)
LCNPDPEAGPEHRELAAMVGRLLAENALTAVYDGSAEGARGALADAVLEAEGRVIGVMVTPDLQGASRRDGLTEFQMVDTRGAQQAAFAELSDGVLILPNGLASLEDLLEIWAWGGTGQEIPCALLNLDDHFTAMLTTAENSTLQRFVHETQRGMLIVGRDPAELLRAMADYRPPETRRNALPDDY